MFIKCLNTLSTWEKSLWYTFPMDWGCPFSVERLSGREMHGKVFFSRQSWHPQFCIFNWYVNNFVSRQGRGINRRNESTKKLTVLKLLTSHCSFENFITPFFPNSYLEMKIRSFTITVEYFSYLQMPTLRNEKQLAAINRDYQQKHRRNNQARDTIDPRNQEDCITQVPEKVRIEWQRNCPTSPVGQRAAFCGLFSN